MFSQWWNFRHTLTVSADVEENAESLKRTHYRHTSSDDSKEIKKYR